MPFGVTTTATGSETAKCTARGIFSDNAGKTVGEYTNYWTNTSGNDLIKEFVHYADESHLLLLRDLLAGKNVTGRITEDLSFAELNAAHSPENLLSLLYASGYLTSVGKNADGTRELTIPNEEVLSCFKREVANYFSPTDHYYQAATFSPPSVPVTAPMPTEFCSASYCVT